MRKLLLAIGVIALVPLLAAPSVSRARSAESVTIHVTSMSNKPVDFAVRYFGSGDDAGGARDHLTTPFDVVVPGNEAYALFRQTGGTGEMRVEVKSKIGSGRTSGPIAMIVVTRDKLAVTGYDH